MVKSISKEKLFIPDEDVYYVKRQQKTEMITNILKVALLSLFLGGFIYYVFFIDNVKPAPRNEEGTPLFPVLAESQLSFADRFIDFMSKYDREYESNEETMERFKHYESKMKKIVEFNKQKLHGADYGENDLSDWSDEEFQKKLRQEATFIRSDPPKMERAAPLPDFFDWRAKNAVTPVKAQGKCGSCWAFASTATVESAWIIAHGEHRNLSEQTLLDCDLSNNACDGGDEDKAFRFIHRHGLAYAADLPYVAHRQNSCHVDPKRTTHIQTAYFLHQDENSIMDWLVNFGPVNIGMAVIQPMRSYKGGVFKPSEYACKNEVIGLHALMIVGYGTDEESGEKYWMIKNSWGKSFGIDEGYIKFIRGINACGIEAEPIGILA